MMAALTRVGRVAAVAVVALALAGCQLVDESEDLAPNDPVSNAAEDPLGSPDDDFPTTLRGILAVTAPEALTWQDEPVLTDVTVWLAPSGQWERFRVGYVAAEADRFLTIRADPDRLRLERPLLEGLQLLPLPQEALAELPDLPAEVLEPRALGEATRPALGECGADGPVRAVLYATGAPAAWDGERWSTVPTWRATVVTADGGVIVDPRDGTPFAPLTCVEPLLLEQG